MAVRFPHLVTEWDTDRNSANGLSPKTVTPGSNLQVWWRCAICGHQWKTAPYVRTKGHGCAACRGMVATPQRNLAVSAPPWLSEWDPEANEHTPSDVTPKSSVPVAWICPTNRNHRYEASPADRHRGNGCPYCAGRRVDESNSLQARFPLLAAEWDHARNDRGPDQVTTGSDYAAWWVCSTDPEHRWHAAVSPRALRGVGCPMCSGRTASRANRFDLHAPPHLLTEWHPTKNDTLRRCDVAVSSNLKIWWQCSHGHEWQAAINDRTGARPTGCPWCWLGKRSRIEIDIACELACVFPDEIDPQTPSMLDLGETRPRSVDILLRQSRVVVEYDGSYTHATIPERDTAKTRLLQAAGYRVLRIRAASLPTLDDDIPTALETPGDLKATVDAVITRLADLGWATTALADAYLRSPALRATTEADTIYDTLTPAERFTPYSLTSRQKC